MAYSRSTGKRYTLAQKVSYYKRKATRNGRVNYNSQYSLQEQLVYYRNLANKNNRSYNKRRY